ncbi:mannose-1-phosphate guanylyltransferase/mannose-6-phosphate isomerase [Echinimonas agarilytica]|uniref:mannose-1-phosphate guanylyltransferase n=1 Tax=Echinimonas agarilytica TaxID=1215918 RepID=A0AA41W981_9GAMM|nr:mannose-1-phosphate guanylyltransferase/mannose-6-phosphate isomerase [Echinimonas agarilytica]MCM2681439.1 mannose-1-phosphate guanylyltransferase/mannose-6-phosphate isomerase [Echinimonas agarilytica]
MIHPVIMAGGSGSRLWPLSRKHYPKQFLSLHGEQTMLQETVARLDGVTNNKPVVISNEDHRFIVAEQLSQIGQLGPVILEPDGRNTAPAVALAALALQKSEGDEAVMLVLAADHVIEDVEAFHAAIAKATPMAEQGKLVTFGIVPTGPETGYGYIKAGATHGEAFSVGEFVEKPNLETAEAYLASGDYFWNSGMFVFTVGAYLSELQTHCPEILKACKASMSDVSHDLDFIRISKEEFVKCPDDSIDYAVMEHTSDAVVIPLDAQWNDVGSWSALWDVNQKDNHGNVTRGDVMTHDSHNSYVNTQEKLVALVGLDDVIVVETKDAVLVAAKDKVQDVKSIVNELKSQSRSEYLHQRFVYRPWGMYDSIDNGERHQVKRITVKPGAKLSVQMHHHRAEHWIVVSGTAKVTNGERTFLVTENESTYIPVGVVHALENPGMVPLELIEVQSGSYLGEDDIVRFEDRYGRIE